MKTTQADRILKVLKDAKGEFICGQYFLRDMYISQFHARILELQCKGYDIRSSNFTNDFGFKSYQLIVKE